jgi:hypothetical protein
MEKIEEIFDEVLKEAKNDSILEIAKQVIKDMKTLNRLLFKKQENFNYKANNILNEMSQETDTEIRDLINRIEFNLNKISNSIDNKNQVIPYNKEEMDGIMINIMTQYLFTSNNFKSDCGIGENYAVDLNKIHTALNNLNTAINEYNTEIAEKNNWPKIISRNEAFSIAKQQINSL